MRTGVATLHCPRSYKLSGRGPKFCFRPKTVHPSENCTNCPTEEYSRGVPQNTADITGIIENRFCSRSGADGGLNGGRGGDNSANLHTEAGSQNSPSHSPDATKGNFRGLL